jgi:predicted dehydrogenase
MSDRKVKLAVIGVGSMGSMHVKDLSGRVPNAQLAAVCDIDVPKADRFAADFGVPAFYDYRDLLGMMDLDGVVIATPHYFHTPISIAFMQAGRHVLTEKPVAVHVNDARKMIDAYEQARKIHPKLKFAIMFQQRTYGFWRKIKEMIDGGELGKLIRATWIITDWYRTQAYYDGGGWRATWSGEGGGVLLNQCPHNLDLYQWFVGMPKRVAGFAHIGKYHNIEVEDEVTGYFEYENGMVGHFLTTTAESPGTNRLEIIGEKGKLTFEDGKLLFARNRMSMLDFIRTAQTAYDKVEFAVEEVAYQHHGEWGHAIILENFANAILHDEPLIAAAPEGINGLTLSNAIMLSTFTGQPVDLPIDADAYEQKLLELSAKSTYQKTVREEEHKDMSKSFR